MPALQGPRIEAKLTAKSAALTGAPDELRYIIHGRSAVAQAEASHWISVMPIALISGSS